MLERALLCFGAAAVGVSQVFFGVILDNQDHFPDRAGFHAWTLAWVLLLPLAVVAGLDRLLAGRWRAWRALLFAAVLLSFARQVQVAYPGLFAAWIGGAPPLLLASALVALFAGVALKWPDAARRYLVALGLLGALLTARYVARTGLWGPAWVSGTSAVRAANSSAPPAFVLVFDELAFDILRDGDAVRPAYPAFARLAAESAFFTNATTNHFWTERSIPAMLTGRIHPEPGRASFLDLLSERREILLFDNALMAEKWVRRDGARRVYSKGKAHYLSMNPFSGLRYLLIALGESPFARTSLGEEWTRKLPPPLAWEAISGHEWIQREIDLFLESIRRDAARGRLTYWHCSIPHAPFVFDREGNLHGRKANRFYPGIPGVPGHDPGEVLDNYREQVGFADRILGLFLDRLRAEGIYQEAVVVVTSDHGLRSWYGDLEPAGFPELRGGWTPRVPLLIKAPGLAPGPRAVDVQHVDLAPTLLRLLDVPYDPAAFQGRSALEDHPARRKIFISGDGRAYVDEPSTGLWRRCAPGIVPEF